MNDNAHMPGNHGFYKHGSTNDTRAASATEDQVAAMMPIETILSKLERVRRSGAGWTAQCPGHDDRKNSLSIHEGNDRRVLLKCFAGCSVEGIVTAMGLTMRDLFPVEESHTGQRRRTRKRTSVTLVDVAKSKGLPVHFLTSLGWHDLASGGVGIPYKDATGTTLHMKRRTAVVAKDGSYWPPGVPLMPYGLEDLAEIRQSGYVVLVEGETDRATLKLHGFPCLGIPGASAAKCLTSMHIEGIPTLYITQEPDAGGAAFVAGIRSRLQELGWKGQALVIRLDGVNDANELHIQNPEGFTVAFQRALAQAGSLTPPLKTLSEVISAFQKWLHLPDPGALEVMLATIAANLMPGDPVWLMLVGPSSSGKTELLQSLSQLRHVHLAATLTEGALLSGTPARDKHTGASGGLLRSIGEFGFLVCKDFTSILSMHRDARTALLAALRELFDGNWTRHVGVDGGRTLGWKGKLALLTGCTETIDSHHAVMGTMGERFVFYRMPPVEESAQAARALEHGWLEMAMRREMAEAVAGLFEGLTLPDVPPALSKPEHAHLGDLAILAARCRSAVERDSQRREIELIPEPEAPGRLARIFSKLLTGMTTIGITAPRAWELLVKLARDSMPKVRGVLFQQLYDADEPLDTTMIATALHYPTTTARRGLEDLTAHHVVVRMPGGSGKADRWELDEAMRERYGRLRLTFSEKSSETMFNVKKDPSELGVPTIPDFSEKVPGVDSAREELPE